ncbi:putative c6 transcription factor [Phaeomoniella chlamydospora]|uniref:Putative c6 transcription factor n=1 Tax=Phaeomoniella chlamydospora TaxID=158046 RepID=A0A0G2HAJ6_PHACM|nr:putative c6 transcription factor [Phaeomoniella chlamydospora]
MHEDSKWKNSVTTDISSIHASLQQVLKTLSLPQTLPLQTTPLEYDGDLDNDDPIGDAEETQQPSYEASPKALPIQEPAEHVPIDSLYQITGLKPLRTQEAENVDHKHKVPWQQRPDLVTKGVMTWEEAERLLTFYHTRLDPFFYGLGMQYPDLESLRQNSGVLFTAIMTVATLHDSGSAHIYGPCLKEFRKLVSMSMFEKRIDMNYLIALCIGSVWLSDMSWVLSGYAIRRAAEFRLKRCYYKVINTLQLAARSDIQTTQESLQEAMSGTRTLYALFVCDQHLSVLYGRNPIMRVQDWILGWEKFLESPSTTDYDERLASQVSLLLIMGKIRDSFQTNDGSALAKHQAAELESFDVPLDQWMNNWLPRMRPHEHLGRFPVQGVRLHYNFARLYLYSTVFRGLSNNHIPSWFLGAASKALTSATAIIDLFVSDPDLQAGLVGVPHYIHGMISFACAFLVRIAVNHSSQLHVNVTQSYTLISQFSNIVKMVPVGPHHMSQRMAEGLEKMADTIKASNRLTVEDTSVFAPKPFSPYLVPNNSAVNTGFGNFAPLPNAFAIPADLADLDFGLGSMPFFDFEGTSLNMDPPT